ncbi:hypothetical protein Q31a_28620 [Aureliella helgolandensis]|uniref:Uncharacterized protein n=1 Tax=Aureliella helgolandensis TaxID=2527968 RepID=A0A518G7H8_9BACT|nr:hypothetical protein Q31a_28620 [Aureliella helgolandensis]
MANLNGFDANSVEPADELEPIPTGKYIAVITDSEIKPMKSGTGNYLQLTFQIVEGEYAMVSLRGEIATSKLAFTEVEGSTPNVISLNSSKNAFQFSTTTLPIAFPLSKRAYACPTCSSENCSSSSTGVSPPDSQI